MVLTTLGFLSVGIYGSLHIEVGFDALDLLPRDSYVANFLDIIQMEYPEQGYPASIVIDKIAYTVEDFECIEKE